MSSCIAVLTRGYPEVEQYQPLVRRNMHIERCLKDISIPLIIFHEGNIPEIYQGYIRYCTPDLDIRFINVNNGLAFRKEKESIPEKEETIGFSTGYRHMCSFWFVDFWHFVKEFDYILRIDDDCYVDYDIDDIFKSIKSCNFIYGRWQDDDEFVTTGLNELTCEFMEQNTTKRLGTKSPSGPYTNVFAMNLRNIRDNQLLQQYIQLVDDTSNIYRNRWGDLALWGEVIYYIFGMNTAEFHRIRYYHASHDKFINT
jgi:hypothetical protein